jgi:hypothetical protein
MATYLYQVVTQSVLSRYQSTDHNSTMVRQGLFPLNMDAKFSSLEQFWIKFREPISITNVVNLDSIERRGAPRSRIHSVQEVDMHQIHKQIQDPQTLTIITIVDHLGYDKLIDCVDTPTSRVV